MNWKTKALIQNTASLLPSAFSYSVYYWMQRRFAGLRSIDPLSRLEAGIDCWKNILAEDRNPVGKIFMETGTGRVPILPIAYWLMGADRIITFDLNPYLRSELTGEVHEYIINNQVAVRKVFGDLLIPDRMDKLLALPVGSGFSLPDFLKLCCIDYIAPGDAAHTTLADAIIDFHTSYNVFEHIPLDVLESILKEGNRIIDANGLFVHRVDYSDHFSHSDKSISAINFLQYSDKQWNRYAGNRYMYMNRLRHDDFIDLFERAGHQILSAKTTEDPRSSKLLDSGEMKLHEGFSIKLKEILSISSSWIVSKKV